MLKTAKKTVAATAKQIALEKAAAEKSAPTKVAKSGNINGLRDIATQNSPYLSVILQQIRTISKLYGFHPVETSIVEEQKTYNDYFKSQPELLERILFVQGGSKPMGVRSSVLPSVLRHYVQSKIMDEQPMSKWMYLGNVAELDTKGALQFNYQFGYEVFGQFNHLTEAQVISAVWDLTQRLGLDGEVLLEINTAGDATSQAAYASVLKDYLKGKEFELCDNCTAQVRGRVLNVLSCNNMDCQVITAEAPAIVDFLDDSSRKHFTDILEALDELALPYQLNQLYFGSEGSTGTSLIVKYKKGNQTIVIGEAAHHELLLKSISGKAMPAFGFTGSVAGLVRAMELSESDVRPENHSDVYLVPLGELAAKRSLKLFRDLIAHQISVHDHFGTVGVKNQLKQAEEMKAPLALIMGQKEAMDEMVILRDVKSGMQEIFSYDKIIAEVKKRLER